MKSTDIALIIFISIVSIGISYFATNAIMGDPSDKYEKIDYINDISGVVVEPDAETFNTKALNLNIDVYGGKCSYGQVYDDADEICITQEEYNKKMNSSTDSDNPDSNTDNPEE